MTPRHHYSLAPAIPAGTGEDAEVRRRLAAVGLISRQSGAATLAQAVESGISDRTLRDRANRGTVERPFRGIYLVGPIIDRRAAMRWAAALHAAPHGRVSHASAAQWLRLEGAPDDDTLHVTVARGCQLASRPGFMVHTSMYTEPPPTDGELPITSPARTLIDLSRECAPARSRAMLADALHRRLVDHERLLAAAALLGPRASLGPMWDIWLSLDPQCESELEQRALALFRSAGIPDPEIQWTSQDGRYRLDFRWPQHRLVVEVDGYRWHSGRRSWQRDMEKSNAVPRGWTLRRFSWDHITRRPAYVISVLAEFFAAAA